MKRILVSALVLTLLAPYVAPVASYAALTAECSNNTTQGGSVNACDSRISRRVEVINRNTADVTNNVDLSASTGTNTITEVNGDVDYTSGDIEVEYAVENDLNYNETTIDLGGDDIEVITENTNTQSNSDNFAIGQATTEVVVENENDLDVTNNVNQGGDSYFDTGLNDILEVNGDVDGESGKIEVEGSVSTKGNHNTTDVNGTGDITLSARNDTTQSDSVNVADSSASVSLSIVNDNGEEGGTTVTNNVDIAGYTGDNNVTEVNGDVDKWNSGDVTVDVSVSNGGEDGLGVNETIVDHWAEDISVITENYKTQGDGDGDGVGSQNFALGEVFLVLAIANINDLDATNNLFIEADTGLNDITEVNGDVDFESGAVDLATETENNGNVNFTDVDGGGDLEAVALNEMTQSDSENTADSFIGLALVVNNYNSADELENNSEVYGYTGLNTATEVNGDLDFVTGDADLVNDVANSVNFNTTNLLEGAEDATATAENLETQSDSFNVACARIDRNGEGVSDGQTDNEKCEDHDVPADDLVINVNEMDDVKNNLFEYGDTGFNELLEVNGSVGFNTGEVTEGGEVVNTGNVSETNL